MKEESGLRVSPRLAGQAADALLAVLPDGAADSPALFAAPDGASSGRALPAWYRSTPADQRLGVWLRRHPSLGARERRWLSDRVYDVLRHGRAYETFLRQYPIDPGSPGGGNAIRPARAGQGDAPLPSVPPDGGREGTAGVQAMQRVQAVQEGRLLALIHLSEAMRQQASAARAQSSLPCQDAPRQDGEQQCGADAQHGIHPWHETDALTTLAGDYTRWLATQPPAVRFSLPDWLWQCIEAAHGEQATALAAHLLLPASTDIRCNLLKGKPAALQKLLAAAGLTAEPVAEVPTALRLSGRPALARLPQFGQGWFELQDAGSQAIVDTCGVRRGARVIDFCAGAGGKTLALAARMRNQGQILAFDTEEARLSRLTPRLTRAGVDIVTTLRIDGSDDPRLARYQGWADLVLVDAPCSGSGTLRRHPDLKWRLQPDDVDHYQQLQRTIVLAALRLLRPGGRLVYATCSLLADENAQQMQWLAERLGAGWQATAQRAWLPGEQGGDAFFMAAWEKPG